jgi:hypothetical protein
MVREYRDVGDAVVDTHTQNTRSEVAKVVTMLAPLTGFLHGITWKIDVVLSARFAALPSPEFGLVRGSEAVFTARADIEWDGHRFVTYRSG